METTDMFKASQGSHQIANLIEVQGLIALGAVFYVGHSGGKDSQAMYAAVRKTVPDEQIRVVHADLGDIEWDDVYNHIERNTYHRVIIAKAKNKSGEEVDLFDMVRSRRKALDAQGKFDAPAWPSSSQRYCTSDLKTGPIWREIRNEGNHPIVVNCCGIRSQESKARAKKVIARGTLNLNKKNTNSKRDAYDWWPIAHWSEREVWLEIIQANQEPHPAYGFNPSALIATENERLSCMFCIFGSRNDLRHAAEVRPDLAKRYINLEIEVRSTMFHSESIADRCGYVGSETKVAA